MMIFFLWRLKQLAISFAHLHNTSVLQGSLLVFFMPVALGGIAVLLSKAGPSYPSLPPPQGHYNSSRSLLYVRTIHAALCAGWASAALDMPVSSTIFRTQHSPGFHSLLPTHHIPLLLHVKTQQNHLSSLCAFLLVFLNSSNHSFENPFSLFHWKCSCSSYGVPLSVQFAVLSPHWILLVAIFDRVGNFFFKVGTLPSICLPFVSLLLWVLLTLLSDSSWSPRLLDVGGAQCWVLDTLCPLLLVLTDITGAVISSRGSKYHLCLLFSNLSVWARSLPLIVKSIFINSLWISDNNIYHFHPNSFLNSSHSLHLHGLLW